MFIVTNREVNESEKNPIDRFGAKPNSEGPNELRIVEATKVGRHWRTKVLGDFCTNAMIAEAGIDKNDPKVPKNEQGQVYCTEYVAQKLRAAVKDQRRHVLLYVHGFNNDMLDVLEQTEKLRKTYGMEVVAFSWPAHGGGAIEGTLSYKRDKMTARVSVGALGRTIDKVHKFVTRFNDELMAEVIAKANEAHPNNPSRRDAAIASGAERVCRFRVSALFHSMGNYLFKHAMLSPIFDSQETVFDNVILAAADANNEDHARWVDQINTRHRIYITINEDDFALRASRMKLGDAQQARLGHYTRNLNATRATYIDFTELDSVGNSHSYFIDGPARDAAVKRFFRKAFQGKSAETDLWYHPADNVYRFWGST